MCGIAGFVGEGTRDMLETMTATLTHRGPDGDGYFFDPQRRVGLGHRRLSIIDIVGGVQPMMSQDKSVTIIFNGEIYNFRGLRESLADRYQFTTQSDTEVIIAAYVVFGDAFLDKLDGMFAFALWDARRGRLLLARDRFGEKPLFWSMAGGTLIFGSELKAIHAHPKSPRVLDHHALQKYFIYEYVPTPQTIWQDIQKLEAGHMLSLDEKGLSIKKYYSILDAPRSSGKEATEARLERLLDDSVRDRLVADVPVGVFLSGGIDSTTIAYFAARHAHRPLQTFSIGFEDSTFDESHWARTAARRIGTQHHERMFTKKEFLSSLPAIVEKLDEPFADSSLLPTYLLSQFTRTGVTVALGGDGGDELLLGYPTFRAERLWSLYKHVPRSLRSIIRAGVRQLPVSHRYFSIDFKLKKFLQAEDESFEERNQIWLSAFHGQALKDLFVENIDNTSMLFADSMRHARDAKMLSPMSALSYVYLKQYLTDMILTKVDRASMYNSLEVRAPFLGRALSEFLFQLPEKEKFGKRALKRLMAPKIGRDIAYRKKKGFGIPLGEWFATDLHPLLRDVLNPERIRRDGLFHPESIATMIEQHRSRKQDYRKQLWSLLIFHMWKDHYGV